MTGIFFHTVFLGGLVYLVARYAASQRALGIHAMASLLLKVVAGFALGYYYMYVQGSGDTIAYHQEGVRLAEWASGDFQAYMNYLAGRSELPFESVFSEAPRALYVSKWVSVIYLTGPDQYWLASLYFSLIAWSGLWALTLALIRINKKWMKGALFSLLYFPSVVFWSSGLTKESLAVGALGIFLALLLSLRSNGVSVRVAGALVMILTFYILWQVKYYYAAALILSLITGFIVLPTKSSLPLVIRLLLFLVILSSGWFLLGQLNPNLAPSYLPEVVYYQYEAFVQKSEPGKYVEFSTLCPEWICIIMTFPYAAAAGIFLPLPFNAWSIWTFIAGLENVLLLALSILYFLSQRKADISRTSFHLSGWLYCLLLAGFLAMSAPNIGTLVRYRVGFLPVFVLLITLNNGYFCRGADALKAKAKKLLHP